jgi:hypothetical protein
MILIYCNKQFKREDLFTQYQSYPQLWIELLTTFKVLDFNSIFCQDIFFDFINLFNVENLM